MRKPKKTTKLTFPQTSMTANFYDAVGDYPNESFEEIARRMLGAKRFPRTKKVGAFEQECRKAFNMGRRVE